MCSLNLFFFFFLKAFILTKYCILIKLHKQVGSDISIKSAKGKAGWRWARTQPGTRVMPLEALVFCSESSESEVDKYGSEKGMY